MFVSVVACLFVFLVCVCQAASQFPQFHFSRSAITASSLSSPSYLTLLASYPLPQAAQEALVTAKPLPAVINRSTCGYNLVAAVSSDASIKLYNYTVASSSSPASLEHYAELKGHTKPIHDIKFHNVHGSFDTEQVQTANGACMLSSCGEDATVRFWDVRQQQPASTFKRQEKRTHNKQRGEGGKKERKERRCTAAIDIEKRVAHGIILFLTCSVVF